ncbi:hypothetical protein SAMN04488570_1869 [Nocardioides scoriae]|uniref:Uncharacterized protein n=1 Tax=Nocardioides scoriae TaxID=642780 RepID=A0A1H1S5A2_9ACTN|nr:hypothetical protein [Nocardioides scoriae]SDS43270.1 hypothetical protein SAMN04488570_1869 [Nocardioides scoriae]
MSAGSPLDDRVPGASRLAWETELDRLELDLHRAERLLAASRSLEAPPEWIAPADRGPMPAYLLPRARELHARQQELMQRLAVSLEATMRRQEASERASSSLSPSVYVDLVG